ncbi:MAG: hypothetical protein QXO92_04905 [Candidatus Bathyarchaeia archaeon]
MSLDSQRLYTKSGNYGYDFLILRYPRRWALSTLSLEEILKEKSKYGRDYISMISRGSIPPENLEELMKRSEGSMPLKESLKRTRHGSSRIYAQLEARLEGALTERSNDEDILADPMILRYRSLMKELRDKRSRGIVSMLG